MTHIFERLVAQPMKVLLPALTNLDSGLQAHCKNGKSEWGVCLSRALASKTSSELMVELMHAINHHPLKHEILEELDNCVDEVARCSPTYFKTQQQQQQSTIDELREENARLRENNENLRENNENLRANLHRVSEECSAYYNELLKAKEEKEDDVKVGSKRKAAAAAQIDTNARVIEILGKLPASEFATVWMMASFAKGSDDLIAFLGACLNGGDEKHPSIPSVKMAGFVEILKTRLEMKPSILSIMHHTALKHSASYRSHIYSANDKTPGLTWP